MDVPNQKIQLKTSPCSHHLLGFNQAYKNDQRAPGLKKRKETFYLNNQFAKINHKVNSLCLCGLATETDVPST